MLKTSYTKARNIIKQYGTGYYRATFLFPREIRHATWIYYQFVRTADEYVDDSSDSDGRTKLLTWRNAWKNGQNLTVLDGDYKKILEEYNIPQEYTEAFFAAMEQDLTKARYQTYAELEEYMYGSAVVIGYTMSHIIGYTEDALPHAKALGEAMQMTNFLRDIVEDYRERGRIYIPQEDIKRFGVTEEEIANGTGGEAWRSLMEFEISRTQQLYDFGIKGIKLLEPRGRRAVYAAALMYKEILDMIERNLYDVSSRIVVSPFDKSMLLLKALWKRNQ